MMKKESVPTSDALPPSPADQWEALAAEEKRMGVLSERLMLHARVGTVAEVDQALAEGADPKRALRAGETPFMRAVGSGNLSVARRLEPLSDVHARDGDGYTLLLWATHAGSVDALEYALQFCDPKQQDDNGQNALMRAISGRWLDAVDFLAPLSDGAQTNKNKSTALIVAVRHGGPETVRALIDHGVAAFGKKEARGATALMIAIEDHKVQEMDMLWPHAREELAAVDGLNPLPHAASVRNERAARLILTQAPWAIKKGDWADSLEQALDDGEWGIADLIAEHAPNAERDRAWSDWIASGKLAKAAKKTSGAGPKVPASDTVADEPAWSKLFPQWVAIRRAERESQELRAVTETAKTANSRADPVDEAADGIRVSTENKDAPPKQKGAGRARL